MERVPQLTIQWSISNQCNLSCDYCHVDLYRGNSLFPEQDKLTAAYKEFNRLSSSYDMVIIEITGGEPSLNEDLRNFILNNDNEKIKYRLNSNGYASIDWWKKVKSKLLSLTLSYHSQVNIDKFIEIIDSVKNIYPLILLPINPYYWEEQILIYNKFKQLGFNVQLQMLYKNFTRGNDIYLDYNENQWQFYFSELNVIEEESIEFKKMENLNDFYGHMCWAGVEQIVINLKGDVYRGWCFSEHLGNIFKDEICILSGPKPCPRLQCNNGFDLLARKSEGSWGMA